MPKSAEKLFCVAMLFYASGALLSILLGSTTAFAREAGNPVALAIQTTLYAGAFYLIALDWRNFLSAVWSAKWIVALSALAILSTGWSLEPGFTLRRSLVLTASTAFGLYFGSRFSLSEQLRMLAWTCGLLVVSSTIAGIALPQIGVDHLAHAGNWQGVFNQKNGLARAMVFSGLVFYFFRPKTGAGWRWAGVLASLTLLFLSKSVTGFVVLALVLVTLPLYRLFRSRWMILVPSVIVLVLFLAGVTPVALASSQDLLVLLHRNPTLTGRTDLWDAVMLAIARRPWLGYGFNTFWNGMNGASASVMIQVGWFPKHAHNGFLDLLLDLGIAGFGIFAAGYLVLWKKALGALRSMRGPYPVWICAYLSFMLIYNLTESSILVQNNLFWMLYVACAATLGVRLPSNSFNHEVIRDHEFQANHHHLQG
jgi:O-antigen ligase